MWALGLYSQAKGSMGAMAMFLRQSTRCIVFMMALLLLSACVANPRALPKRRRLDVQTKMSASVYLDPVPSNQKKVFLHIKNTSDKAVLDLEPSLRKAMEKKGYRVVNKLEKAHYLLQATILHVGPCDRREAEHALERGFGAALTTVADAGVQDRIYSVVSDIQISERMGHSFEMKQRTRSKLKQDTHGVQAMVSTEKVNWKRYQTRIVSTVTTVHLTCDKAVAKLLAGLNRAMTGLF
jgi:Enterobacterial TraT complement resistance protein